MKFSENLSNLSCPDLVAGFVSHEHKKQFGIVYTPQFLAEYVALKTVSYFLNDLKIKQMSCNLRIIDPACGDGELLSAVWHQLNLQLKKTLLRPLLNPKKILCGIDINNDAITKTMARIISLTDSTDFHNIKVIKTNALFPLDSTSREEGWAKVKDSFDAHKGFDILIANPPWGAETVHFKESLLKNEYSLYKGQFDSSDLFVELALSIVKPGGYLAFILPDSLFSFERRHLREMLLTQTNIKFVARLGEKIFQNINRACALLICKKQNNAFLNKAKCLRLTPELRNEILLRKTTFHDVENLISHNVSQRRFHENKNYLFDIDVTEDEEKTLNKIKAYSNSLGNYLSSSRGVELSKNGKVCQCKNCSLWIPFPTSLTPKCTHCNAPIRIRETSTASITSKDKLNNAAQLIVGENIKRYHINSHRWILTDIEGINYKNKNLYSDHKIIVRKTGVGISATIDYSGAYTNQVVYIFKLKDKANSLVTLEFLLALINSRLIYYFILKNFGETEWRSHPYITQKQVLDLPLPHIDQKDGHQVAIIETITKILKPCLQKNEPLHASIDATIEYLIAKFFNLTKNDYVNIYNSLNKAEELLPIKALKQIQIKDIFSNRKRF